MKKKEKVLEKVIHFTEDSTSGLFEAEREKEYMPPKHGKKQPMDKIISKKNINTNPNWNALKRKTSP